MKITRRKALAIGAVAIASPLAIAQGSFIEEPIKEKSDKKSPAELPDLHVYEIDDGEQHWFASKSKLHARREYENIYGNSEWIDNDVLISRLPDDKILEVRMTDELGEPIVCKTSRDWANMGPGIIASTVY